MNTPEIAILTGLILVAAMLYSSVGHAGASAYLAAMALVGVASAVMKPTALILNILVAVIATVKFYRAGCFSWALFWPFAVTSVPLAFLGGATILPSSAYKRIIGLVLLYAAYRLVHKAAAAPAAAAKPVPGPLALAFGAVIGFLSGLVGVGGGIFLSPLLLCAGWADARHTCGVAAAFILVNSIAGLGGHLASMATVPAYIAPWAVAAIVGGWLGSTYGSRRFGNTTIRRMLAAVLVVASLKMILA